MPAGPALLAPLSFLLTAYLSDPLFGDVLAPLQGLDHAAEHLALPTPRDAFPPHSQKLPLYHAAPLCSPNYHKRGNHRDPGTSCHVEMALPPSCAPWGQPP